MQINIESDHVAFGVVGKSDISTSGLERALLPIKSKLLLWREVKIFIALRNSSVILFECGV